MVPGDAHGAFASYGHDPEVTRYLTWRPHRCVEETQRVLEVRIGWWRDGPEFSWVITVKPGRMVIGMISANRESDPGVYSLGYVLARPHWGNGYATEAARGVIEALLAQPEVTRVFAIADYENVASHRVLEKAGMRRERLIPRCSLHPAISAEPRDCWMFAKVRK